MAKTKTVVKDSLAEKKLAAAKLKMAIAAGKEKNVRAFKFARREIAQILTKNRAQKILESLKK